MRVGQYPGIKDEIGFGRHPALVGEGFKQQRNLAVRGQRKFGDQFAPQLVHIHAGGINHRIGMLAQWQGELALVFDRFRQ